MSGVDTRAYGQRKRWRRSKEKEGEKGKRSTIASNKKGKAASAKKIHEKRDKLPTFLFYF